MNIDYAKSIKQLVRGMMMATTLLGNSAFAVTNAPTEDGLWYYEIGGAESVSVPTACGSGAPAA